MRFIILLAALMPFTALADALSSAPLFYDIAGRDPKYADAANKAQQAFLTQTGILTQYNQLNGYIVGNATHQVSTTIDSNTPFSSKGLFFVMGTAYEVGVKKQVSKSFNNPFIPGMTNSISVGEHSQSLGINLKF